MHSVVNSIVISTITALKVRNIILSTKNSSPGWDDIPACVAKKYIDYYIDPLTHIINNSIQVGVFPSELKLARVVPLFKSGDSNQVSNFRPISVLTFFSKIYERVMYNHLVHFLDSNARLYQYQFGFLLLVVSLHQSDPLSDTFFCDIVVNHEIIKRAFLSQQRALEEMFHRLISFFIITRGVILISIFPLS